MSLLLIINKLQASIVGDVGLQTELHVGGRKCLFHCHALGELHVHRLYRVRSGFLRFGGSRETGGFDAQAERTEVAEAHRVAVLQSIYHFILQRIEHGFHVGTRNGRAFFHALDDLCKCHRRGRCHLRIESHCFVNRVLLCPYHVLYHNALCFKWNNAQR